MQLAVDQLELGPIGTNTYVVRAAPGAAEAVVVDPSGDAATIQRRLGAVGASCAAILVTHGHFDHIVSLAELADATGAPVYAPEGERAMLERPEEFAPPGIAIPGRTPDVLLRGGEAVEAAGIVFEVLSVPGHSPAHLAYRAGGHLFSGDVLFAGSVGRTDLPGSDWAVLEASIGRLVEACPRDTIVCPGHGPQTTLGAELEHNPFLVGLRGAARPG